MAVLYFLVRPAASDRAADTGIKSFGILIYTLESVMGKNTLTVVDNRTGQSIEVPVEHETVKATDFRQLKVNPDDFGMMTYDPGYKNTASCKSQITFIDGDKGILEYRGYDIADLAKRSTYLEVAYLLLHGDLPTPDEFSQWKNDITYHTMVHENIKKFIDGFRYDAHPMGMLVSTVAALSTYYPEARDVHDPENRRLQVVRLLGKLPTLAAYAHRHAAGLPYVYPDNSLGYAGNFMNMMYNMNEERYEPNPVLEQAIDLLFILHADHEQNCSTSVMRSVGSSQSDPYCATSAAASALYGPLHGGANEAVLHMLADIGSKENVPGFLKRVKDGETRLMGFGHRVYRNYDPRAKLIKEMADKVFAVTGTNPLLEIALQLEQTALKEDYFVSRRLYPNVDFYSGLIYEAMGIPLNMFPVMFAIPRTSGWLSQWQEMIQDPEQKIARPRQVYLGKRERSYVPLSER